MNPLIQSKNTTILPVLIALTLGCFGLSPQAQAVCQEGCLTHENTALGDDALLNNTTGLRNTAIGLEALALNTTGSNNTATGSFALVSNTTGDLNTATGESALQDNTNGFVNTATGFAALFNNETGDDNTATGREALKDNTTGNENTAIGSLALLLSNGSSNIALGFRAGLQLTTGNANICIGNEGFGAESGVIRIGTQGTHTATYIAGIVGVPVGAARSVGVTTDGQLGVKPSSARYKEAIETMNKASEALLNLKPVTFRYKKELDPKGVRRFGLVAEAVAKVDPDLVDLDAKGKPFTVRYDEVNAMLLNEFLKEHRKVEEQGAEIAELRAALARQAAVLQKVSERLESIPSTPRLVENR